MNRVPLLALSICVAALGCNKASPSSVVTEDATPPPQAKAAPPPPPSPLEQVQKAPYLMAALIVAKPHMEDEFSKIDDGSKLLLAWAAKSMKWTEVGVSKDETTFALVQKDADEERGKRLCASGNIIQIEVEKAEYGKVHSGLIMSDAGNLFRFLGVGGSGTLVQGNRARFCGVVTGRFDYPNSAGGTGHAVKLVGMFDLPENRSRT